MRSYILFGENMKYVYYLMKNKKGIYVLYEDLYFKKDNKPLVLKLFNIEILKAIFIIPKDLEDKIIEKIKMLDCVKEVTINGITFVEYSTSFKPYHFIKIGKPKIIHNVVSFEYLN